MAYRPEVRDERRCRATTKSGERCPNYSRWSDPSGLCAVHGGPHRKRHEALHGQSYHARDMLCNGKDCEWKWPHRAGCAGCRWNGDISLLVERKKPRKA